MSEQLVGKLLESFEELDRCINHTRGVLSQKQGISEDVLSRVEQYAQIVNKQKTLASELKNYIELQNWEQVTRHVRLINGLSSMIRDDARAILSAALNHPEEEIKPALS